MRTLSKKTQYTLRALYALSRTYGQGPTLSATIAKAEAIPQDFLENILLYLKRDGLVSSKKGKGGGYYLYKKPQDVNLIEIIRLMDGAIAMLPCVSLNYYEPCEECPNEDVCGLRAVVLEVREASIKILSKTSIADIIKREQKLAKKKLR